jgi:Transposase IS4
MGMGELLKFFGVLILITRFEFSNRRDLWSPKSNNWFIPTPAIGMTTRMSKHQFDILLTNMTFSNQPETRPKGMSLEKYQWRSVDDFVQEFNKHQHACFFPLEMITIDKSMIQWYGIGGHWINAGLPNYVAIDRKPENGCENACCRQTGIMMVLHLVKGPVEEELELDDEAHKSLHGCKIMLHLLHTWTSTRWQIVCADSYLASSSAAMQLYSKHFWSIGVVKTATWQ